MGMILLGAGDRMNILESLPSDAITVSDEDPKYLRSALYDRLACSPFQFLTNGADREIKVDLSLVTNGGMETDDGAGNVASWTETKVGAGSDVTRTTTAGEFNPSTGSTAGMKLVAGAAGGSLAQGSIDFVVRRGWRINV